MKIHLSRHWFSQALRFALLACGGGTLVGAAAGLATAMQQQYTAWSPYLLAHTVSTAAQLGAIFGALLAALLVVQLLLLGLMLPPRRAGLLLTGGWLALGGVSVLLPQVLDRAVRQTPAARLPVFVDSPAAMSVFIGRIIDGILLPERMLETLLDNAALIVPFFLAPLVVGAIIYVFLRWPLKRWLNNPMPRRPRWALWVIGAIVAVSSFAVPYFAAERVQADPGDRPNLVLISIDTLRTDVIGAYGATVSAAPSLDELAASGVRFAEVRAPSSWTVPSHAALLTGRWPWRLGVRRVADAVPLRAVTLAEMLADAGYQTRAVVTHLFVDVPYGMGQGFARVAHPLSERAPEAVEAALRHWQSRDRSRPMFLFVHLYDPHWPYDPLLDTPSALLAETTLADRVSVQEFDDFYALIQRLRFGPPSLTRAARALYAGEVYTADRAVGRLLHVVAESERPTLVSVVADHGELFGEHSFYGHGISLYEPEIRVPWIVAGPDVPAATTLEGSAGLIDVMPTLLGLLGVEPTAPMDGMDFSEQIRRGENVPPLRWVAGENMFVGDKQVRYVANTRWKWFSGASVNIRQFILSRPGFFTRIDMDPGELRNTANEALGPQIGPLIEDLFEGTGSSERQVILGQDDLEMLRALGYVE